MVLLWIKSWPLLSQHLNLLLAGHSIIWCYVIWETKKGYYKTSAVKVLLSSPRINQCYLEIMLFNFDLHGFCRCSHCRGSVLLPQRDVFECHLFCISVYTRNKWKVFASDCTRAKDHVSEVAYYCIKWSRDILKVVRVFGSWDIILCIATC